IRDRSRAMGQPAGRGGQHPRGHAVPEGPAPARTVGPPGWATGPLRLVGRDGRRHSGTDADTRGQPMTVMITSAGGYLILALVFLVLIGGGVYMAYRMNKRMH